LKELPGDLERARVLAGKVLDHLHPLEGDIERVRFLLHEVVLLHPADDADGLPNLEDEALHLPGPFEDAADERTDPGGARRADVLFGRSNLFWPRLHFSSSLSFTK